MPITQHCINKDFRKIVTSLVAEGQQAAYNCVCALFLINSNGQV